MKQHVTAVAWLHIGLSIVWVILGFAFAAILMGLGMITHDRDATEVFVILSPIIMVFCIATALPSVIGGIFLLRFKEWSRILIIIVSFIDLINFPIGTALGVYSLWVLLNKNTIGLFLGQPTQSPAAGS